MLPLRLLSVLAVLPSLVSSDHALAQSAYDPLRVTSAEGRAQDLVVRDAKRERDIPLRVYVPAGRGPFPVVLFSHGLGGSRENSPYLGKHWSSRGYAVVFMQHIGSDESVWKGRRPLQRMSALRKAASVQNFALRADDVRFVLDAIEGGRVLPGQLDMARVGMTGHSFGAITTQAVSGQTYPAVGERYTDPRIKAAMAMSPSAPRRGSAADAFGAVRIPWLLMTGTRDVSRIGDADLASRLAVFTALPDQGHAYQLVLYDAEHSAFGDRPLPGDRENRNPNHHRVILALSTAFWDAWLLGSSEARAWLDGDRALTVLERRDTWKKK